MTHLDRIAELSAPEIRGAWSRLNDSVLRQVIPEQPGERAAVIARAKVLRVELEAIKTRCARDCDPIAPIRAYGAHPIAGHNCSDDSDVPGGQNK